MFKRICKRAAAPVLVCLLVLFMSMQMVAPAHAAEGSLVYNLRYISAYDDGYGSWSFTSAPLGNGAVTGTAKEETVDGGCNADDTYEDHTSTLTLINQFAFEAKLSFNYEVIGIGTVTAGGETLSGSDAKEFLLAGGDSVKIEVKSAEAENGTTTLNLTSVNLIPTKALSLTPVRVQNGSYTVAVEGGSPVTVPAYVEGESDEVDPLQQLSGKPYTATAQPADGYEFFYWQIEYADGTTFYEKGNSFVIRNDATITPVFSPVGRALFSVNGKGFYDLQNAIDFAVSGTEKTIIMTRSGTVPTGNYTIPSGVTLLLPYVEGENTVAGDTDPLKYANYGLTQTNGVNSASNDLALPGDGRTYLTMSLADGVNLTVNGQLVLGGVFGSCDSGKNYAGQTAGAHSDIKFEGKGNIYINGSSAKLSCLGFIYNGANGKGKITVNGGEVYIPYTITDYIGGRHTVTSYQKAKVTPFNSYTCINVQVPMELKFEQTTTAVHAYCNLFTGPSGLSNTYDHNRCTTKLISHGDGSGQGFYQAATGASLLWEFTPGGYVNTGRIRLTFNGTFVFGNMTMELKVSGISATVNSKTVDWPISYNWDLVVQSGSLTVPNEIKVKMFPGATLSVEEEATFSIQKGGKLTVYDAFFPRTSVVPSAEALHAVGFSQRAHLYVQGTMNINGTFGGLIETKCNMTKDIVPKIVVATDAELSASVKDGLLYGTDDYNVLGDFIGALIDKSTIKAPHTNRSEQTLVARIFNGKAIAELEKGQTYFGDDRTVGLSQSTGVRLYTAVFETNADGSVKTEDGHPVLEENIYTDGNTIIYTQGNAAQTVEGAWVTGYELTYDKQGGDVVSGSADQAEITPGASVTLPDMTRTGYTFTGWKDADGTVYAAGATFTMPRKDVLLTAQWTPHKYTVKFNANGGSGTMDGMNFTYDQAQALLTNAFVRPYHTFLGWDTNKDATSAGYIDGQGVENLTAVDGAEVTLYAIWDPYTYTVHFDGSNATEGSMANQSFDYGVLQYLSANGFIRSGYTFRGWDTDASADTVVYGPDAQVQNLSDVDGGTVTLYAVWEANWYYVAFEGNAEDATNVPDERPKLIYDQPLEWKNNPTRPGYTFLGWDTDPNAAVPKFAADDKTEVVTLLNLTAEDTTAQNAVTLYAIWQANTNTKYEVHIYEMDTSGVYPAKPTQTEALTGTTDAQVTYKPTIKNGFAIDNGESNVLSGTIAGDGSLVLTVYVKRVSYQLTIVVDGQATEAEHLYGAELSIQTPQKQGYTFSGWYTDEACQTPAAEIPATMPAQAVALYGKLIPNTDTKYKVYIYEMDTKGVYPTEPTEKLVENLFGTTGETATYTPEDKEGFIVAEQSTLSGTIAGDGSLVLHIYYQRQKYTFTTIVDGTMAYVDYYYGQTIPAISDPAKTGHTFAGWDRAIPATMPAENLTITATWSVNNYNVTFDPNGGNWNDNFAADEKTLAYGSTITPPANPTREGYTFAGWYLDQACTQAATLPGVMPANRVTYYAKWTAITYTVTFDPNGGTCDTKTGSVVFDSAYGDLPTPSYPGYNFAGWMIENTETQVSSATIHKIAGDVVLVAQWTQGNTVTWNVDGETIIVPYTTGAAIDAPDAPSKPGYKFLGWGISAEVDNTEIVTNFGTMGDTDLTYYAKWTANTVKYTVEIYQMDETGVYPETPFSTIELSGKTGHTGSYVPPAENGFRLDEDQAGYATSGTITVDAEGKGTLVLKVYYSRKQYTVIWKSHDGTTISSGLVYYGAVLSQPSAGERPGYTFAGWEGYTAGMTMPANDVTFTTAWTVNSYTLTFKDGEDVLFTWYGPYGSEVGAAALKPSKEGYTFNGWDKEIPATMPAEDQEFQAKFTVNSYTITFGNTGDAVMEKQSVAYSSGIPDISTPTKTGHTFAGWVVTKTGTDEVVSGLTTMPAYDLTYTAKWSKNSYTVIWTVGGETVASKSVEFGAEIPSMAAQTKIGHTFSGWSKAPDTMPADDVTITAEFIANQYTVHFDGNGATGGKMDDVDCVYDKTFYDYANSFTRTGYTFAGWNTQPDGSGRAYGVNGLNNLTAVDGAKVTLYAQWTANSYTVKFNGNDGSGNMLDQTFTYDKEQALRDNAFTRTGHTFQGWSEDSNATVAKYGNLAEVKNLAESGSVTLYAVWTANPYTITWDVDGVKTVQTYLYGALIEPPADPTKTGYTFTRWDGYTAGDIMGATPVTYTAQWSINKYTISFENTGDTVVSPITQNYGTVVAAPGNPTWAGYRFEGWNQEIPHAMGAENITIRATWVSYLALLVDCKVPAAEDVFSSDPAVSAAAGEALNIARAYFMQLNEDQKETYQSDVKAVGVNGEEKAITYKAHRDALFATIQAVATADQEQAVINRVPSTNQMFAGEDKTLDTADDIASLVVDAENKTLTIWIEDRTRLALDMLGIDFLQNLFQSEEIYGFDIHQLNPMRPEHIDFADDVNMPYEGKDPFTLMLYIAYATINEVEITGGSDKDENLRDDKNLTFAAFTNWLAGNDAEGTPIRQTLSIGILDGKEITATVLAKTPEGVGYSITYQLVFQNRVHDAYWNVDGESDKTEAKYGESITDSVSPMKTGHTFIGWEDAQGMLWSVEAGSNKLYRMDDETPVYAVMGLSDQTYTAQWKINQYTITFVDTDGTQIDKIQADYGAAVNGIESPTKTGHTFAGWDRAVPATMPAENLIITATWSVNNYNVTFDPNGGNWNGNFAADEKTLAYGSTITPPANPTREGYTFAGWDQEIPDTVPAGGLTITATWTANIYQVKLQFADGITGDKIIKVSFGQQYGDALPTPTRDGYTFVQWVDAGGNVVSTATVMQTANDSTVLTAQWEIGASYTITYQDYRGWPEGTNPRYQFNVEDAFNLPIPVCEGYDFLGWVDETGKPITAVSKGTTKDLNLTAQWKVQKYTVTWIVDGKQTTKTYEYGATITLPEPPAKEGYTFTGWSASAPATMPANDLEFTACWKVIRYTITFVDGVGNTVAVLTQDYDTAVTAPMPPTRTGYEFKGWDKTVPSTMPAEDLTITATWQVEWYQVTFKNQDGTNYDGGSFAYGSQIQLPTAPIREGYTFTGWEGYTDGMTMPAQDQVFTATWKVNYYNLIYMVDGTEYKQISVSYGSPVTALDAPEKIGYLFSGWSEIPATMPAANVTVNGSFTAASYHVDLDQNYSAAERIDGVTVTFDSPYGALPTPIRTGYIFDGWYLGNEKITANTIVKTVGDHTLVAKWAAKQFTVILDPNGGSLSGANTLTVTYDGTYGTLPVPSRTGYDFAGWFTGNTQISADMKVAITADQTLVAKWNASGDTKYVVYHHIMDLDGKTYTLKDTFMGKGATGATISATQNSYTGFTFNADKSQVSGVIAADGSLALNLYYDRQRHTVVWNVADKQIRQIYLYGAALQAPDTTRADDLHASYTFTGWNVTLPGTVTESATYTAQYSLNYEAVIGGTTYRTLKLALGYAKNGQMVSLARNVTVAEDLTVPAGVILLVPCMDNDPGYVSRNNGKWQFNHDGISTAGGEGLGPKAKLYRTLTIADGATLTVDGTMLINSVSGRPATSGHDQDITGGYGQIDLHGDILVRDSGTLDCFGYIKGSGTVTAKSGAVIGDLFLVRNWRGGTQGLEMYQSDVYPMNEHDCNNIRANLKLDHGATLEGLVKMYAQSSYYYTRFPQVDKNNGLIRLDAGAYLIRSVEEVGGELRTVFKIYGGADFASSTLEIVGLDITSADFPYPYDGDIDIEVYDGRYDFVNHYKFMTGATFLVGDDADLYVAKGVSVTFYRAFDDSKFADATVYPNRGPAVLTVSATGSFTNAGSFGGTIVTSTTDIFIGAEPVWSVTTREGNGWAHSLEEDEESYYEVTNTLILTHTAGKTWKYGADKSIVWDGMANYSAVQQAIAAIPDDLSFYTDASIAGIQPAIDAVVWNLDAGQQARVDAMAQPILDAIAKLQLKKVTLTLDPVGGTVSTNTFLVDSIGKISEQLSSGKLPTPTKQYHIFQGWYDENGNRVRNSSQYKSSVDFTLHASWVLDDADYTQVKKARAAIPSDMSMYTEESAAAVNTALNAVDWTLTADRQAEVDAMAQAIWDAIDSLELKKVTLTLNASGGTVTPGSVQVSYTQTVGNVLPTPVRPGYTFQGWYDASGVQFTADTQVDFAESVTLTARWKANRITVTFDPNGGALSGTGSVSADYDTALTKPADPSRTGYSFTGWYLDAACTKPAAIPATMPTANTTYYAGWQVKQYALTLKDADGAVLNTIMVDYGAVISKPTAPSKEGHTFIGWKGYTEGMKMPAENLSFTATWQVNRYTITLKDTDGTVLDTITQNYGAAIAGLADPEKIGYTFQGWDKPIPATMPAEDLTITANWTANTYQVTLDTAGGTLSGGNKVTVTYDGLYDLPVPVRHGYTFIGWYLNGERVYNGNTVKLTSDASMTAHWIAGNAFTIDYMLNGGQWPENAQVPDYYREADGAITLPVPTREGYTFLGWTGSNGDQPQRTVTISAGSTGNKAYTANWKITIYTVTWVVDGQKTQVTYEYGAAITKPADPTKAGHTFTGWDRTVPATMPAEDLVITASFRVNQYQLVWVVDGQRTTLTLDYGADITKPADPAKTGHTFIGWGGEIPATMPAEDLTFTAAWQLNRYTITFDPAGGTAVDSIAVAYGTTIVLPAAPTRTDYLFLGWEGYEDGMTMPAENITLTAKWAVGINKITSDIFVVNNNDDIGKIKVGTLVQGLLAGIYEREYCTVYDAEGKPAANDALVGTGMTVQLTVDGQLKETVVAIVTGDVTGDGKVTVSDMIQMKAQILETKKLTGAYAAAADVSGDGKITISDFVQIKAYILGKGSITAR